MCAASKAPRLLLVLVLVLVLAIAYAASARRLRVAENRFVRWSIVIVIIFFWDGMTLR